MTRSLKLDWSARAFADAPPEARTLVITCAAADPAPAGARPGRRRTSSWPAATGSIRTWPCGGWASGATGSSLCEGGPTWLGELVAAGLVDELCLTLAPLMGGDPLPVSVAPPGAPLAHFALRHVLREGDTLFLRYERGPDGP